MRRMVVVGGWQGRSGETSAEGHFHCRLSSSLVEGSVEDSVETATALGTTRMSEDKSLPTERRKKHEVENHTTTTTERPTYRTEERTKNPKKEEIKENLLPFFTMLP
jgi:hypothetical protein